MKRKFILSFALVITLTVVAFCKKDLLKIFASTQTWDLGVITDTISGVLDDEGTLTISGSGVLKPSDEMPWYKDNSDVSSNASTENLIKKIIIEDNIEANEESSRLFALSEVEEIDATKLIVSNSTNVEEFFAYCSSLYSLKIGDDFEAITQGMFSYSEDIFLTIETNNNLFYTYNYDADNKECKVTSLHNDNAISLDYFYLDSNKYCILDYPKTNEVSISCSISNNGITEINIPNKVTYDSVEYTVTAIADFGFENCTNLTKVVMPDSITTIGNKCFSGCISLNDITISKNINIISEYAFENCSQLQQINLPNKTFSIGQGAFRNCSSLENVNFNIDSNLSSSKGSIRNSAFRNCINLETINLPDNFNEIDNCAFENCTKIDNIQLNASIKRLGSSAFSECSSLTNIVLPDGLKNIETAAFKGDILLDNVELPSTLETLGSSSFMNCSSLQSIVIPEGIRTIKISTFENCSSLNNIEIKGKDALINKGAFNNCPSLLNVKMYKELSGYETNEYFPTNTSITYTYYNPSDTIVPELKFEILTSSKKTATVVRSNIYRFLSDVTIPEQANIDGEDYTVTTIDANAFYECDNINSISFSTKVSSIESNALRGTNITNIVIPENIRSFSLPDKLRQLDIKGEGRTFKKYAFSSCKQLEYVKWSESYKNLENKDYFDNVSQITFEYYNAPINTNAYEITYYEEEYEDGGITYPAEASLEYIDNTIKDIVVPDKVTKDGIEYIVTWISGFNNNKTVETILYPDTITGIGNEAFEGCTKLKSFKKYSTGIDLYSIDSDYYVSRIYRSSFQDCSSLEEIDIINVSSLEKECFKNCTKLDNVIIPDTVTEIEESAFENCTSLTTIVLSNNLKTIKKNAFKGTNIQNIIIPASVELIEEGAFAGNHFKSVTILSSNVILEGNTGLSNADSYISNTSYKDEGLAYQLTSFEKTLVYDPNYDGVYEEVEGLEVIRKHYYRAYDSVTIPEKAIYNGKEYPVIGIDQEAFSYCTNLKEINLPDSLLYIGEKAFGNTSLVKLDIPVSVELLGDMILYNTHIDKVIVRGDKVENNWGYIFSYSYPKEIVIYSKYLYISDTSTIYGNDVKLYQWRQPKVDFYKNWNVINWTDIFDTISVFQDNNLTTIKNKIKLYLKYFEYDNNIYDLIKNDAVVDKAAELLPNVLKKYGIASFNNLENIKTDIKNTILLADYIISTETILDGSPSNVKVEQLMMEYENKNVWDKYVIKTYQSDFYDKLVAKYITALGNNITSNILGDKTIAVFGVLANTTGATDVELVSSQVTDTAKINEITTKINNKNGQLNEKSLKVYDISLVDKNDNKIKATVTGSIEVKIEISKDDFEKAKHVWHLHDDGTIEEILNPSLEKATEPDGTNKYFVKFYVTSFSKFIITEEVKTGGGTSGGGSSSGGGGSSGGISTPKEVVEQTKEITQPIEEVKLPYKYKIDLQSVKYIEGYGNKKFKPNGNATREEAATIISRICKDINSYQIDNKENFSDVSNTRWSYNAISFLSQKGVIQGYDGMFRPSDHVSRGEFISMIARLIDLDNVTITKTFKDINSEYYKDYANKLLSLGIISGDNKANFNGKNNITRAEVCKIINNILGKELDETNSNSLAYRFTDVDKNAWYYNDVIIALQ